MLSDAKVRAAKAADRAYKLSDGGQLYLRVGTTGARSWRMNYKFAGGAGDPVQKTLTIGAYPAISLKDAREARDRAKALLAKGVEPRPDNIFSTDADRMPAMPFETMARAWHALQMPRWSKVHAAQVLDGLITDVFSKIGAAPIGKINATDVMATLQPIVDRGAVETAHRTRQRIGAIFAYAIALGHADTNPATALALALPRKPRSRPQPALTDLRAIRQLLIDCDAERCRAPTKWALRFLALTAVRPGEVHGARWTEFEGLDGAFPLWRIPAARMKGDIDRKAEEGGDHLVPLAPASVDILRVTHMVTGDGPMVFPSDRNRFRPMSENTLRALLIRAGYYQRHVPHGFRAAFSTIMNELVERQWREAGHNGIAPDRAIIDLMLAHVPKDRVEPVYNRAAYLERRRELACDWADILVGDMWPPDIQIDQPMRFFSNAGR